MKLDEIFTEWEKDSYINPTDLANESLKISRLHHKYIVYYTNEKRIQYQHEQSYKDLIPFKKRYYFDGLGEEEYKELSLDPAPKKLKLKSNSKITMMKADEQWLFDADEHLSLIKAKIELSKTKSDLLKSIIEQINKRTYAIKSAIDYLMFNKGDN
jgi:hypothetical protein